MFRPGFGAGDVLAGAIIVIGLTILLFLTEAHFVAALGCLPLASEMSQTPNAELEATLLRLGAHPGENAKNSLKVVGMTLVSLSALGFALACIPSLRSLIVCSGLIRSSSRITTAKSPNRPLRLYLKMLTVSAILATILYMLVLIGVYCSNE